jgi:hypothetical protein
MDDDDEFRSDNEDVVDALRDVESAVLRVEKAVKDKWSSVQYIFAGVIAWYLFLLPGQIWHSKWRYASWYNLSSDKVIVDDHPHDCSFVAAPLGEKYCHYDREASTVQWAKSQTGSPIVSYDEGKTWSEFTPDSSVTVPRYPTVMEVHISWKKIEE